MDVPDTQRNPEDDLGLKLDRANWHLKTIRLYVGLLLLIVLVAVVLVLTGTVQLEIRTTRF